MEPRASSPAVSFSETDGTLPSSGRTTIALAFRSTCEPPLNVFINPIDCQLSSDQDLVCLLEHLPADRVSRKAQGWRLHEECDQVGSQQPPIREGPAGGEFTRFFMRLATP